MDTQNVRFLRPEESEHLEVRVLESGCRGAQTNEGLIIFQLVVILIVEARFILSEFVRKWVRLVISTPSVLGA